MRPLVSSLFAPNFAPFTALLAVLLVLLLTPAVARAELDCWVPNREESHTAENLPFRSARLTPFRDAVLAADQVVRDNPHFKAMPRKIRIRSSMAIGGAANNKQARYGALNVTAYRPDVWEGKCGLSYGADRCCSDGNVSILFNEPRTFLGQSHKDEQIEMFEEPKLTGRVAGFPEYRGMYVMLSSGERVPWIPVTVAEYLDLKERRMLKEGAEFEKTKARGTGLDPATLEQAYQNMKKIDPKAAEDFRTTMQRQMETLPVQQQKHFEKADAFQSKQLADLRAYRAALSAEQLRAQAREGIGPQQLAAAGDPHAKPLVKLDPRFFEGSDPHRVRLISVFVGVVPKDPVAERRETMQKTRDTLDYARLAQLLR